MPTRAPRRVAHVQGPSWDHPWLEDLVTRLPARGWEPVVVSLDREGPLQRNMRRAGLRTAALGAPGRQRYPLAIARLTPLLRDAQVVHAHLFDAEVVCAVACTLARRRLVITRHASAPPADLVPSGPVKRAVHRAVDRTIVRRASAIIAPSGLVRQELLDLGARPSRVRTILLGVDMDRLTRHDVAAVRTLRDTLAPGSRYVVLAAGRLSAEKRTHVLVRAWNAVAAARPDAMLLIAGEGPERGRLERLSRDLGIAGSVRFLGWRTDVGDLIAAADAVVHTSANESTGLVLLEALALAKPLVTTSVGIVNEYLAAGVHCIVVPHLDDRALAQALLWIPADPPRAEAMGRMAQTIVRERSAIEPMVDAYADIYDSLFR